MTATNGQISDYRLDELVEAFIVNRNNIREIEARHKLELAKPLRYRERLAEEMLKVMNANGEKSVRTAFGTVTAIVHESYSCRENPDLLVDYVRENDAYELLDRRPNKTACREFLRMNGELPPGVKLTAKQDVRVLGVNEPEELTI